MVERRTAHIPQARAHGNSIVSTPQEHAISAYARLHRLVCDEVRETRSLDIVEHLLEVGRESLGENAERALDLARNAPQRPREQLTGRKRYARAKSGDCDVTRISSLCAC